MTDETQAPVEELVPVVPRVFSLRVERITDVARAREAFEQIGVMITLISDQTLQSVDRDPEWWEEVNASTTDS